MVGKPFLITMVLMFIVQSSLGMDDSILMTAYNNPISSSSFYSLMTDEGTFDPEGALVSGVCANPLFAITNEESSGPGGPGEYHIYSAADEPDVPSCCTADCCCRYILKCCDWTICCLCCAFKCCCCLIK